MLAALSEATTELTCVFAARSCGIFLLAFAAARSVVTQEPFARCSIPLEVRDPGETLHPFKLRKNIIWALSNCPVTDHGWQHRFDMPTILPIAENLITLRDAATYITRLQPQH